MTPEEKKAAIERLSHESYAVTQHNATERPFTGKYNHHSEKGIYVDIVSGEPLFASSDKFNSGCGWPAFSRPISKTAVTYLRDQSHGMDRVEVRSKEGDSHLGHVFDDGPANLGGMRYCINSAALDFIPYDQMDEKGYSEYKDLVK